MRLGSTEAFPELSEEFGGAVNVAAQLQKDCKELAIGDVVLVAGQAVTIEACLCLTSNNKQTFKVRLGFATLCSLFFSHQVVEAKAPFPRCHLSENRAFASTKDRESSQLFAAAVQLPLLLVRCSFQSSSHCGRL